MLCVSRWFPAWLQQESRRTVSVHFDVRAQRRPGAVSDPPREFLSRPLSTVFVTPALRVVRPPSTLRPDNSPQRVLRKRESLPLSY
jgi:hypothetical protein